MLWLLKTEKRDSSSIVVLSIHRVGVVIGNVVEAKLNTKLDVVVSRKIGAPIDPEFAIGAVMSDVPIRIKDRNLLSKPSFYRNKCITFIMLVLL